MKRRKFIKDSTIIAGLSVATNGFTIGSGYFAKDKIRLGFIGVGARGLGTLELVLLRKDVEVTAICDIDPITMSKAVKAVEKAGQKKPQTYTDGPYAYKKLLEQKDIDGVFICTPWEWHTPMSVDAMQAGKAVACEVAGGVGIYEGWGFVSTF